MYPEPDGIIQEGKAILTYGSIPPSEEPRTKERLSTAEDPSLVYGCSWEGYSDADNKLCLGMEKTFSDVMEDDYGLQDDAEDVTEYFLNVGFNYGSSINARKFLLPKVFIYMIFLRMN